MEAGYYSRSALASKHVLLSPREPLQKSYHEQPSVSVNP
jgi:hypothetical protein